MVLAVTTRAQAKESNSQIEETNSVIQEEEFPTNKEELISTPIESTNGLHGDPLPDTPMKEFPFSDELFETIRMSKEDQQKKKGPSPTCDKMIKDQIGNTRVEEEGKPREDQATKRNIV